MTDRQSPRRTCILVDLENYSGLDGIQQGIAQQQLEAALTAAAQEVGLNRLQWERQPTGDGELAVLPDRELQAVVVGAFPVALDAELRERHERGGPRLRLRMSVVYGVVTPAQLGYADHAVVAAARIADAGPVRRALEGATTSRLVLALSSDLFRDVIMHGDSALKADRFRRVPIDRIEGEAWITIPGLDPDRLMITPVRATRESEDRTIPTVDIDVAGRHGTVYQSTFNGGTNSDFHFGPRHG